MPKRRADANSRRFFDEFACVRVSRLRASGVIDPAKRQAVIRFAIGKDKLIGTAHVHFPQGGRWSFFTCPNCNRLTSKLWDIEDRPLCAKCCNSLNIWHRTKWGFGRRERLTAKDKVPDELTAKLEATRRCASIRRPNIGAAERGSSAMVTPSQCACDAQ